MIKSVFYSRFHPEKGPNLLYQVPAGSISTTNAPARNPKSDNSHSTNRQPRSSSPTPPPPKSTLERTLIELESPSKPTALFSFSAISDYLVPRNEYRDTCITVCINGYRVIGYPVSIYGEQYARNEFIFNVAIVVDVEAEVVVWTGVVKRIAALLKEMEEVGWYLSEDEHEAIPDTPASAVTSEYAQDRRGSKVYALCEMILEDLNNYCECMIPLDPANTLNLKLFPVYPPPPEVADYHVPLLTVSLSSLADQTWDISMQRIAPHINGANSVSKIAALAGSDALLIREAVTHLVYCGCCLLLDVFSFSASYAVTPAFRAFVADEEMQNECTRYVSVAVAVPVDRSATEPDLPVEDGKSMSGSDSAPVQETSKDIDVSETKRDDVVRLYASLRQGVPLRLWCLDNKKALIGVDVRRLITFGIIRGFLYRVHKYAVATSSSSTKDRQAVNVKQTEALRQRQNTEKNLRPHSLSTITGNNQLRQDNLGEHLFRYLDGLHCFDEICTDLEIADKTMISFLKARGDVQVIQR